VLSKAEEHLRSAGILWRHGQYRDAVSRAYYASFSAMCAFVGEPPRGRWEHPGLRGVFVQQLSVRGVPVAECRRLRQRLRSLHDARTDADYTNMAIDETTVQEALTIAREILEVVQRYEQR
jgi:uncharacterized protein (UPF0332 family)